MIEITIKTLDSRNHEFSVQDDLTVKQLKEQIAESVNVPAESQRLIYCGRVLLDDKKLSEYDVNGKVIHLVQRAPPNSGGSGSSSSSSTAGNAGRNGDRAGNRGRLGLDNAMYLGAMAFPADLMEAQGLTVPPARHTLSQSRLGVARSMLRRANTVLQSLEGRSDTSSSSDPPTPAEPVPPTSVQAAVTISADPPSSGQSDSPSNGVAPRPEHITAAGGTYGEALTAALGHVLNVHHAGRLQTPEMGGSSNPSNPADPMPQTSVQAAVTISTDPPSSTQSEPSSVTPRPEQIAAAAAEAVTAALGHALNVHHAGNVSITLNNGDGSGSDDLMVRVTQGSGSGPSATGGNGSRPRSATQRTPALADLVSQLREVQRRMEPYLDRYHSLMRDDPADASDSQQVFNQVSELMHVLAHAYHALSDIMCDLSQPPPRVLRCRPVLIQHSAVLQTGIPINVPAPMISLSSQLNNNQMESGSQAEGQTGTSQAQAQARSSSEENRTQADTQSQGDGFQQGRADNTTRPDDDPMAANPSRPDHSGPQQGPTATVSISPSNLEIFMDVSSGSITFDSVEATVLHAPAPPSSNPPTTEQTNQANSGEQPPWNQQSPHSDFIQNLFHRFYSEMSNIHNNNYNNNNNNSNNSGGSSSRSSQPPSTPAGQSQASSSGASTTATTEGETSSSQTAQSQSGSTGSNGSSAPPHPPSTDSTPQQPRTAFSRPHIHIGPGPHIQTVDFFDPFLPCNSHHIRGRRRAGTSTVTPNTSDPQQQSNESSGTTAAGAEATPSGSSGSAHPTVQMTLLPSGPNRTRSIVHHIIPILPREIVRNLQANNGGSGTIMRSTVAQLLESIPGQPYSPGQSLIMDFFMTAGRNIMLQDIVSDMSPAMLGWMRPGLREYLENTLGVDPTCPESTVQAAVDRINAELTPFFETPFEGLTMREDVDLPASIRKVSQAYLPQLIKDIHQADNFTTYTMNVSQLVLKFIRGIISVLAFASQTPRFHINNLIIAFSRKLVQGNTAEVRSWLMGEVVERLHQVSRPWEITRESIREFIVYVPPPPQDNSQPIPMELEETVSSPQLLMSSPLRHSEPLPNFIIGSEPWHRNLPTDWVPIIAQDRERQRRGANQGPLSDAYLAGMPSKRRKLLTDAKPNSSLNKVISESMGRALGAAGLTPSATADLVEAAACDSGLRSAYKAQVRSSVESTLRSHPDYHPDKYPNTAKYFNRLHRS